MRAPALLLGGGLLALAGAFAIWRVTDKGASPSPERNIVATRSVAVLPFDDVGAAAESTYFADGITEEIIDALGRIPALRVISRTSAFAFKEKRGLTLRQIAESLKVGSILEGSVRKDGSRLRVIARLVDVTADSQLFARNFTRELRDVFALQNEIAEDIAGALRVSLTSGSTAARPAPTRDLEAYDLYLQGRAYANQRNLPSLREAVRRFERAIARDSSFVAPYVGLSDALLVSAVLGSESPAVFAARARAVAERALQLDSASAGAHVSLGHALFTFYRDLTAGERHLRRAMLLDSTYTPARFYLGILHFDRGEFDKSIALLARAEEDDPRFVPILTLLGRVYLCAGQVDSAIAVLRRSAAINPAWSMTHSHLGHALLAGGMSIAAIEAFRRGAALGGANDSAQLVYALAATGRADTATAILNALLKEKRNVYNFESAMALAYLGFGDREGALRWLDRIGPSSGNPTYVRLPAMAPLRAEARYQRVLHQFSR